MGVLRTLLPFGFTSLTPALAVACPACFTGSEESRQAYVVAALLMTILPFVSIGGVVLWIALEARKARMNRSLRE